MVRVRAALIRLLLAAALAVTSSAVDAQCITNFCPPPPGGGGGNKNLVWYIVGGTVIAIVGALVGFKIYADQNNNPPPSGPTFQPPPNQPPLNTVSLPPDPQLTPPAPRVTPKGPVTAQLRNGFNLPPPGITAFVQDEVMLDIPASVPTRILDLIAANHNMTRVETKTFRLTGRTLHRWHINNGSTVRDMIVNMARDTQATQVAGAQPIFLYEMTQAQVEPNKDQYAPEKLDLTEAHRLATGNRVLVAVIDFGVDATHPDLANAIVDKYDATDDEFTPHAHGTGMAGAIAAHRTMLGTAPRVGLLTARAFGSKTATAEGTTFNIIKALDWAVEKGARVINMSFAGPPDPRLRDALAKTAKKGIVLIAAAGNAGPRSPPLFPAADPNVIAVTATDIDDALFPGANRGKYIAVAAPGVDVLVPGPNATYQLTTGTSVASAEVSGVAALLLERNPKLTPADVRRILTRTAKAIAPKGRESDFGAGLVNAFGAVSAARSGGVSSTSKGTGTAATAHP